jgi:hypothetical protein
MLTTLEPGSEGLLVPVDHVKESRAYELRKFGKALVLVPKENDG